MEWLTDCADSAQNLPLSAKNAIFVNGKIKFLPITAWVLLPSLSLQSSKLTHEQTRYIFETNTIGITDESINKVMESARALYAYLKDHCVGKQTSTWDLARILQ